VRAAARSEGRGTAREAAWRRARGGVEARERRRGGAREGGAKVRARRRTSRAGGRSEASPSAFALAPAGAPAGRRSLGGEISLDPRPGGADSY
jgi:hypothetical protein